MPPSYDAAELGLQEPEGRHLQGNVSHLLHRGNVAAPYSSTIEAIALPPFKHHQGMGLMAKLEVLYNDDCPICRREIKHYASLSGDAVEFVKITEQSAADWGLTPDQATQQIHARSDGKVIIGVDAFISVWQKLPYYRVLAPIVGWRPIKFITSMVYRKILAPLLYAMHQRRQRRQ